MNLNINIMKKHLLIIFLFVVPFFSYGQNILITEVVDGTGSGGYPKYVEITNTSLVTEILDGYTIDKSSNGNAFSTAYTFSSFSLGGGQSVVVTNMNNTSSGQLWTDFGLTEPTFVIHGISAINGNGDDAYRITNGTDTLDIYGVEQDGSGEVWEYLDSYAHRNPEVTTASATFNASEWTIAPINTLDGVSDMSSHLNPGTRPQADTVAPAATFSPADGVTGIRVDTNIRITFDENIYQRGGTTEVADADLPALILIKRGGSGGVELADNNFAMTYDNTNYTITIDPTGDLSFSTAYYVAVDSVFDDNNYGALGGSFTFTTGIDSDTTSYIVSPENQISAATIASTETDSVAVFSFSIFDVGDTDGVSTIPTRIKVKAGPNNTVDLSENLRGGYIVNASNEVIMLDTTSNATASEIIFNIPQDSLVVPDDTSYVYRLFVHLNNENIADSSVIQFMIDADDHGAVAHGNGSQFLPTFLADVVGNDFVVSVTATQLEFKTQPQNTTVESILNDITVAATDGYGNTDVDYSTVFEIIGEGATLSNSPVSKSPTNGVVTFDNLSFEDANTNVELIVSSGTLLSDTSLVFSVNDTPNDDLFFSEYIEGSSNNKALEIYNPTSASIDLSNYAIVTNNNGGTWFDPAPLTGTLEAEETYVIINPSFNFETIDSAAVVDTVWGAYATYFSGDDARALAKLTSGTWQSGTWDIIDQIGDTLGDPGTAWDVAGTNNATQNYTLLRKPRVSFGNTNWSTSSGTSESNSEWIVKELDYLSDLGYAGIRFIDFSFPLQTGPATIDVSARTINIEVAYGVDPSSLVASFILTGGVQADVNGSIQTSGVTALDFTNPVAYTLTAEGGITKTWTITVTVSTTASSQKDITGFTVDGIVGNAVIGGNTVNATVAYGSSVTSLKPTFEISLLATISDTTTARDFTTAQTYVVTAQDGTTKTWTVSITPQQAIDVETIAALRAMYTTTNTNVYRITDEVTFTYASAPYYYIQDGTAGILIYSSQDVITTNYNIGDNVQNVVATFDEFGGNMQLIPVVDPGAAMSTGNVVAPQVLTIADYKANFNDYNAELVRFNGVRFTQTGNFQAQQNYTITNGTDELTLRTNFADADYINTAIPSATMDIIAIGSSYNDSPQVYARNSSDLVGDAQSDNLIDPDKVIIYPNPSNGLFNLEFEDDKESIVEVYDVIGKLIYQDKVQTKETKIDLREMNSGVYYINVIKEERKDIYQVFITK